jgi:hypothetical protein
MTDCFSFMDTNGMGWMMWSAGLLWLLVLVLLFLAAAALIKFLRTDGSSEPAESKAAIHRGEIS